MKILLILPDAKIHKISLGSLKVSFREAPLTATMLAALVPEELDADIKIVDESVGNIPYTENFDLVGISCLTGTAPRAYKIADHFRNKNATVVLGGVHVTLMPNEAKKYADSVVIGFAEQLWPELLKDFKSGKLKKVYENGKSDISNIPVPRRDLQKKFSYLTPNTIYATRGCKGICDFCTVPVSKYGWQTRSIGKIIDELKGIKARRIVFNDVSMGENIDYLKELLSAIIPLKKKWGGLVSTKIFKDNEIIDLLGKSGCIYLLIGFESINNTALSNIYKGFNKVEEYSEIIKKLHDINIVIQGCFIFGFDEDNHNIFRETVEFANNHKIDIPRYAIYTPYPHTRAFKKLEAEGRILHRRWEYYDTQHVVFLPKQMTPEELDRGFKWTYKNTFTVKSSLMRTLHSVKNFPIAFFGNLAYKLYIKRLFSETNRVVYNQELI